MRFAASSRHTLASFRLAISLRLSIKPGEEEFMQEIKSLKKKWLYSFPIAIVDEGVDVALENIKSVGVDVVALCTSIYAPYRLVMPRNRKRAIYQMEEGKFYFFPDEARYSGCALKPQKSSDFADMDVLGAVTKSAKNNGLEVGSWVPLFANGYFAKQYPEYTVQNLYGSRDRLFLCFNHPQVREFAFRLAEDIVSRYDIDYLEIDKIPQICMEETAFAGRVEPVLRTVGTFCFCEHCVAEARKRGLDLESVKAIAHKYAADSLSIPPYIVNSLSELRADTGIPLLMVDEPLLLEMIRFRIACVFDFLKELTKRVKAIRQNVKVSAILVPPVKIGHDASAPRAWLAAQSYKAFASAVDLIHTVIHWEPDVVAYDTKRAVDSSGGQCKICTDVRLYGPTRPEDVALFANAAILGGADAIGFFCYDLASEELLEAVKNLLRG